MQAGYVRDKAAYDAVAVGLNANERLGKDAEGARTEAAVDEGTLDGLHKELTETQAMLDRAEKEAAYERGEGKYLREFCTHADFFANRLHQAGMLTSELQRQREAVQAKAGGDARQRAAFTALQHVLETKLAHARSVSGGAVTGTQGQASTAYGGPAAARSAGGLAANRPRTGAAAGTLGQQGKEMTADVLTL